MLKQIVDFFWEIWLMRWVFQKTIQTAQFGYTTKTHTGEKPRVLYVQNADLQQTLKVWGKPPFAQNAGEK